MTDLLDPVSHRKHEKLLDDEISQAEAAANIARELAAEAERLAREARDATEVASAAKEKRQVVLDIQKEAYHLVDRLWPYVPRVGSTIAQMSFISPNLGEVVQEVIAWPATSDDDFAIAMSRPRGIYIGRYEMGDSAPLLVDLSEEQLMALDLPVLQEILEHISQIGVQKPHVELPPVESSPVELPSVERRLYNSVDSLEAVDEVEFAGSQREEH